MEEIKLIDLLRKLDLTKLEVEFITNGTRFPSDDLIKLLDQCRWVNIHVSMDGVPRVNEWCRWPVNHQLVVSNMKRYRDWGKADLKIASLINIYNVWTLEEFHGYCEEVLPDWKILFNWVKSPPWQSIGLIPHQLRPTFDRSDSVFEVTRQMMNSPVKSNLLEFKRNTDFLIKQRGDVYSIVSQLKRLEI
jgi:hypothetical protein